MTIMGIIQSETGKEGKGKEGKSIVSLNVTNNRRQIIILNYGIQPYAYYFLLPNPQFISCPIYRQDYLNCPPSEVVKKRHGCRSLLFLAFKGFPQDFGTWYCLQFVLPWRRLGKIERPKPPGLVFNDDRQRWESTDQLFPLGRAWAIRRREFSVWFAHFPFLIEVLVANY